ncbi:hypothetical protein [Paludibacter sp.]|uniref:hypothetical protein n=1 Tax=Paludibacter sp. TaxID=1898105 RepID=UPI0013521E5E|nr:hypothetical protein [Paludibacter sp.]MTK53877.1 hypothetical protein [Paludibacter sp.]
MSIEKSEIKYNKELYNLMIDEFKSKYVDCSTFKDFDKIKWIINKETVEQEEERLFQKKQSRDNKQKDKQKDDPHEDKLSDDTIKRAFGFISRTYPPNATTRSVIARAIGYKGWDDFCKKALENYEAGFQTIDSHFFSSLITEQLITIGWYPRKYCILKYLGEYEFEVIENCGLKSKIARRFETTGFQLASSNNKNKVAPPDIVIEPLLDDDPDWELIKMGIFPMEYLL